MSENNPMILIVGRGQMGTYLCDNIDGKHDCVKYEGELASLSVDMLKGMRLSLVVNTVGKTSLEWCDANPIEAYRCNVEAPLGLWRNVKEAFGAKVPFVHLSSGCIWDGPFDENNEPFGPDSPPTPACYYAWTKAACEAMMLRESVGGKIAILRPRQVFSGSCSPRNTLDKLRRYDSLIDTPNSMTSASTILRAVIAAWARMSDGQGHSMQFVMNVYDDGIISPYQVGMMMAKKGLREPPKKTSKAELDKTLRPRRVDVVMRDELFEKIVGIRPVREALAEAIEEYAMEIEE